MARMWLGFSPDMDLGQFEEAAVQERRIVKAIRESVCAVVEAPERSQLGAPLQALFDLARAKARLELVSVQFVNFAEHRATARMRAAQGEEDGGAGNSVEWEFAIEGDGERFQVRDLVLVAH